VRTVAVIALKGGSGKTTAAAHLALAAHLRGERVMVADLDRQASLANVLSAREAPGPAVVASTGRKLLAAKFAAVAMGQQLLIIDTPAGAVEDVSEAVVLADLAVMVVRPTLLDLAGLAPTLSLVRGLAKPSTVVLSQAPQPENGVESPLVRRALRALDYMRAPLAPVILRARPGYQTALETGRSVEETGDAAAAAEVAALWAHVEGMLKWAGDDALAEAGGAGA
jgi:chromosome partitioning protein